MSFGRPLGVRCRSWVRPMHSVPVPINVRCYSNSDMIVRRSEVTLRAINTHRRAITHVRFLPKAIRRYRFAVKAFQAASESI